MSIGPRIDVTSPSDPGSTTAEEADAGGRPVGRVETVSGPTVIVAADGSRRAAASGASLGADESVVTAEDGSTVITLADGSRLALAADTRLAMSSLVATPASIVGDGRLTVIHGILAVSGGAASLDPSRMLIVDSPFGEIAVQGGPIVVWCDGMEAVMRVASPPGASDWSGLVTVSTAGGVRVIEAPGKLIVVVGVGAAPLLADGDPDDFATDAVAQLLALVADDERHAVEADTDPENADDLLTVAGAGGEEIGSDAALAAPIVVTADPAWFAPPLLRPLPEPSVPDELVVDPTQSFTRPSSFAAVERAPEPMMVVDPIPAEQQFPTRPIALSRINVGESAWTQVTGWSGLIAEGVEHAMEFYRGVASHVDRGFSSPAPRFGAPPRSDGRVDDGMMLAVSAGSYAPPGLEGFLRGPTTAELEAFLGLPPGKLAAREPSPLFGGGEAEWPISGAAIKTSLTLGKDEFFVFDVLFDPADGERFNDFAFLTIDDTVFTIASRQTTDGGTTGWRTVAYGHKGDRAVGMDVGIGVVDDRRADIHPYLLIDNVRRVPLDAQRLIDGMDPRYHVLDAQAGSNLLIMAERPTTIADAASVGEDASITIRVTDLVANDRAALPPVVNGSPMSTLFVAEVDGSKAVGGVSLHDGLVAYEAVGRFDVLAVGDTAQDVFRYRVVDAGGGQAWGEVTVTIVGRNDAPVAQDGRAAVAADGRVDIPITISDVDDAPATLKVVSAAAASGATLTFGNPGGWIAYDAAGLAAWIALGANEQARDVITYTIADPHGAVANGRIDVDVFGVNDRPVARNTEHRRSGEDTNSVRIDLLDSAVSHDPDAGDVLGLHAVVQIGGPPLAFQVEGGMVVIDGAGFESVALGMTETYTFAFTVGDGHDVDSTASALLSLVVEGRNDPPRAATDVVFVAENGVVAGNLFSDNGAGPDSDVDRGDSLRVAAVNGRAADVDRLIELPAGGMLFLGADGGFTYRSGAAHDALRAGEALDEVFTYTVADSHGANDTALVRVRVTGVNDAPAPADDHAVTDAETAVRVVVLANDHDPDAGATLTVNRIGETVVAFAGHATTLASGATVRLNPDGSLTYDPGTAFADLAEGEGAIDAFTYGVSDGEGGSASAAVTIGLRGVADVEVGSVLVESFEVPGRETGWLSEWTRTGDIRKTLPEDMPVRIVGSYPAGSLALAASHLDLAMLVSSNVAHADPLTRAADIESALDLPAGQIGRAVGLTPNTGAMARTQVWLQNSQTLSFDFAFASGERGSVVSSNDFAIFTIAGGELGGVFKLADIAQVDDLTGHIAGAIGPFNAIYRHDAPAGMYTIGFAVFNHATDFNGSLIMVDNIRLDANVRGYRPNGEAFQIVAPPPRPADDALATTEDGALVVPVGSLLANDRSSPAGGVFTVADVANIAAAGEGAVTLPSGARVTVADGVVTYDPSGAFNFLAAGAFGHDLFFYTVVGGNGAVAQAAVGVDLIGVNDPPTVASALSVVVDERAPPLTIDLFDGVTDPDLGDTLRIEAFTQVAGPPLPNGARVDNALSLDPEAYRFLAPGDRLTLEFRYEISDGPGKTDAVDMVRLGQTLTITVEGANHPPTVGVDAFSVDADAVFNGNLITGVGGGADVDVEGDALAVVAFDAVSALGVPIGMHANGDLTYDPRVVSAVQALPEGVTAADNFVYTIADGHGGIASGGVSVAVRGVNDVPTAADDVLTTDSRTPIAFTGDMLLANDRDVDIGDSIRVAEIGGVPARVAGSIRLSSGAVLQVDPGGAILYDPNGAFDTLARGQSVIDSLDYAVVDGHGASSVARVQITVAGVGQSRLVDGFEGGFAAWTTRGATWTTDVYIENDAIPASLNRSFAAPDGGGRFAVLGADDPAARSVVDVRGFLGLTESDLSAFRDSDFSQAANGAAMRLAMPLSLAVNDIVSFAFAFDNRDYANLGRNDYAIVVIGGEVYSLIEGRAVDASNTQHRLSSDWRLFEWRAPADGAYDFGLAVFDDTPDIDAPAGDPAQRATDSRLLLDSLWINAPTVGSGYSVDPSATGGDGDPVATAAASG